MVAVIKTGHSIPRILAYNENKVKEGRATCISAGNYPMETERLTLKSKLNRLLKQAALNENVTRNSVHISLNFDPSENISTERLMEIAGTYMQKIGFGEQPYLVYQHLDAGHPHIHIVSVKVGADGSRKDMQNIGRNRSEKARKEIELTYGLIRAGIGKIKPYDLKTVYTQKIQYGRTDSKRAIGHVLDAVLNTYKYASLAELNAILKQYNVWADQGKEHSRVRQHHGLLYHILDDKGHPVGVPIKASAFYNKPTLKYLEERFPLNDAVRQPHKVRIKNVIDLTFLKQPEQSLEHVIKTLEKEGIHTVVRRNLEEIIYGLTYIDHHTKCVFNGSLLGKPYSAKGILERCHEKQEAPAQKQDFIEQSASSVWSPDGKRPAPANVQNEEGVDLLKMVVQPEHSFGFVPHPFTKTRRKKRGKRASRRL